MIIYYLSFKDLFRDDVRAPTIPNQRYFPIMVIKFLAIFGSLVQREPNNDKLKGGEPQK